MPSSWRSKKSLRVEKAGPRQSRHDGVNEWVCGSSRMASFAPAPVVPVASPSENSSFDPISPVTPASTTQRAFDFSWADDVEEELFSGKHFNKESSVDEDKSNEPFTVIDGHKYKYAAGKRPPLLFSLDVPDAKYQYEGESPTTTSDLASPSTGWNTAQNGRAGANQGSSKADYWQNKGKGKKRMKKHTQNTPGIRPDWEFYENQASEDPFEPNVSVNQILEPVEPTPVVENLWADYHNQPPLPLHLG